MPPSRRPRDRRLALFGAALAAGAGAGGCTYDFEQFRATPVAGGSGAGGAGAQGGAAGNAVAPGGAGAGAAAGAAAATGTSGSAGSLVGAGGVAGGAGAPGHGGADFDCDAVLGTRTDNRCYFQIAQGPGLVWEAAKTACSQFSATSHLVTITSAEEEALIEETFFPAVNDLWLGLSLADTATHPPPSACVDAPETCPFVWITGEAFSYGNWLAHSETDVEPNYSGACVRIQMVERKWADTRCDTREGQIPAICEHEY